MKTLGFTILAAVILALPICAQSPAVAVNVPFGFVAGNATLPAGQYTVDMSTRPFLVGLIGADRHTHLLNTVPDGVGSAKGLSELVFHRYGDRYFLSEIRTPGRSREIPESGIEREAQQTAGAGRASQEIVLAMR
jgi:hypothetical protein